MDDSAMDPCPGLSPGCSEPREKDGEGEWEHDLGLGNLSHVV